MEPTLRVLLVDAASGFYRMEHFPLGPFFGPVSLGLHLAGRRDALCFGTGLLAGSILPGSNRLIVTGRSPCWGGFYVSSMGGAGLVFDRLGLNLVGVVGRAPRPSLLYLNRSHGEEIRVEVAPLDLPRVWEQGRGGVYGVMEHALHRYGERYPSDPRVLAVGPAAATTDCGAIASAPVRRGKLTPVDTWAGRGGMGSALLQRHGLAGVVFGGSFLDDDFRDRKVADVWFRNRYDKKLAAKDVEATIKYRYDPVVGTGGTLGVNYAKMGGRQLAFSYATIGWSEQQRLDLHADLVRDHYLAQFNAETIVPRDQHHCGEPCAAVCKKLHGDYKKDYEPYQTMGPLCGVFDQRAAERLNGHADRYGFDAISIGGVLAWLMECLHAGDLSPEALGVQQRPRFGRDGFDVVGDSEHNAALGVALLDRIVAADGALDLRHGARALAWRLSQDHGAPLRHKLLYTAFGERGWMVPNQYWTPGVLSPMPIMGKYYNHYKGAFLPPAELGRRNVERLLRELLLDELGTCRFHRAWAEDMLPEIVERLWGCQQDLLRRVLITAGRLDSRNAGTFWESQRCVDFWTTFLKRRRDVEGDASPELQRWIEAADADPWRAAEDWWYALLRGQREALRAWIEAGPAGFPGLDGGPTADGARPASVPADLQPLPGG